MVLAVITVGLVILGLLGFFVYFFDTVFGGYDISTSREAVSVVAKIIGGNSAGKGFTDLGCAWGNAALAIKKTYPELEVTGVDDDPIRIFLAGLKAFFLRRRIKFIKQDLFKADVSSADIVYLYHDVSLMPRLENKLQNELKPGARVIISNRQFPNWQPIQSYDVASGSHQINKIFLYQKD